MSGDPQCVRLFTVRELIDVVLRGGSFDGKTARAPDPPGALRLGVHEGDLVWTELYLHVVGEPGVMQFMGREAAT